jgi:hypothetical protein
VKSLQFAVIRSEMRGCRREIQFQEVFKEYHRSRKESEFSALTRYRSWLCKTNPQYTSEAKTKVEVYNVNIVRENDTLCLPPHVTEV